MGICFRQLGVSSLHASCSSRGRLRSPRPHGDNERVTHVKHVLRNTHPRDGVLNAAILSSVRTSESPRDDFALMRGLVLSPAQFASFLPSVFLSFLPSMRVCGLTGKLARKLPPPNWRWEDGARGPIAIVRASVVSASERARGSSCQTY